MSSSDDACDPDLLDFAFKQIRVRVLRTNVVLVLSVIMVAILVGAGSFSRRYRRHGSMIRLLFLGAYTMFLPLVSYVVSGVDKENCALPDGISECTDDGTRYLLVWPSLVQIVGANYCIATAPYDDQRRNINRTVQLLFGAIWTLFLVIQHFLGYSYDHIIVYWAVSMPCALSIAKILTKLYTYEKAWNSLELGGRNPRLIAGYMKQLNLSQRGDKHEIPLILMGEDKQKVKEGPGGFLFTDDSVHSTTLVTLERVTNMMSTDDSIFKRSEQPFEDLCLSFSLFKLLRLRFTSCPVADADQWSVPNFMSKLQHGNPQDILGLIGDELSFACDFYYSYLPVSYSTWWLPFLNVLFSFLVIAYCLAGGISLLVHEAYWIPTESQMTCTLTCGRDRGFGYILIVEVLTLFLGVPVLLSETWEIISYTCSNWTKVKLISYYITKSSWQRSPLLQRLICCMLRFKCKILNNSYKMGQTSIMDTSMAIVIAVRRLLRLPDQMKYVKIPPQVNTAIVNTFRSSNYRVPPDIASLQRRQIGNNTLPAYSGTGTSDVILVWHIATCIFEIRHPQEPSTACAVNDRITASHLSRYCAYLLSSAPELLPDDKAWLKRLYKSVKKITKPLFSKSDGPMEFERLLQQLAESSNSNTELKNGVALGVQLVDETQDAEEGWRVLAGFWSDMVLYIAPSDNLGAHGEAIARGGELITILWAMLTHAGIISRPRTDNAV